MVWGPIIAGAGYLSAFGAIPKRHHVWCSMQNALKHLAGADNCVMCASLRRDYPEPVNETNPLSK